MASALVASACGGSSDGKSPGAKEQAPPDPISSALLVEPGSLTIAAVDLNGDVRWGVRPTQGFSVFSGMVLADGVVYGQWASCGFGDAGLAAFDLVTGEQKWRTKALFGGETQDDWTLPSVLDSTYVALSRRDEEGAVSRLIAVSTEDGSVRWQVDVTGNGPAVATVGGPVVAVAGSGSLRAYDRRAGTELWSAPVAADVGVLASDRDRVFVTTSFGGGALGPRSTAYDARTGKVLWSSDGVRLLGGTELSGGVVPAGKSGPPGRAGEELVMGLDAATGTTRWQRPGLRDSYGALKQAAGRLALHTSLSGGVTVLDAVTGKDVWTTADTQVIGVRQHGVLLHDGRGATKISLYDERGTLLGEPPHLASEPDQVTPLPEVTSDHVVLLARGCPGRG